METSTTRRSLIAAVVLALGVPQTEAGHGNTPAPDPEEVESALRALASPEMQTRRDALEILLYSGDPRIAKAALPLLQDEGDTTRTLAARTIGSRWPSIPRDEVPQYVEALHAAKKHAHESELNEPLIERAIGLLRRDYSGSNFSRSPDRRWVIYERHGFPAVIDTNNDKEWLLMPEVDGEVVGYSHGGTPDTKQTIRWRWDSSVVAVDVWYRRHSNLLLFWRPSNGKQWTLEAREVGEKLNAPTPAHGGGFRYASLKLVRWEGDRVVATLEGVGENEQQWRFTFHPETREVKRAR